MSLSTNSSAVETRTIHLYCVRIHDTKVDFEIKADFGKKITFEFKKEQQPYGKDSLTAFIYKLDLEIQVNSNKQIRIYHNNNFEAINEYHLIIPQYKRFSGIKMEHQEKSTGKHKILHNFDNPHNFLFGIRFSKSYQMEPPGENSCSSFNLYLTRRSFLGISTNYFDDLCLFTFYLLCKPMFNEFDALANQFHINLDNSVHIFDEKAYTGFFEKCNSYIKNILRDSNSRPAVLKIILRMVGLLPIKKDSFFRQNPCANAFATEIMQHVRTTFDSLLKAVNDQEQLLFGSGLAILLCIELLYSNYNDSDGTKLKFLFDMPDTKQRQDIANNLLEQLYELNLPIHASSTWTDLFTIVNPDKIKLQDMHLTNSFETYITIINKVLATHTDTKRFYNEIIDEFKKLIRNDHFRGKNTV